MQKIKEYFVGKKITVMGLGLLGRGMGDAKFLAEMGAEVTVTDLKTEAELAASVANLREHKNVTFVLGEHRLEDFADKDFILVAAGVPADSPYLRHASEAGVPLKQSAAWFAELSRVPVIGVTGTRGKSTVTHMIHHVLFEVTGEEILLGGNIRGVSNLQLLKRVKDDSLCVMELDSWQLQGWGWAKMSPQIAVFTNFMEDHLNYYQTGDLSKEEALQRYFADKANIFKYQEDSGVLVTTPEVFERAKSLSKVSLGQEVILVDGSTLPKDLPLMLPGEHNRLNAALAYEALKAISLTDEEIFPALTTFSGVEGRLQYLKEYKGVKIYNDNNATTPIATVKALEALGDKDNKKIILIAGGADKNIDASEILAKAEQYCKEVILLPGTGTDKIIPKLKKSSLKWRVTEGELGEDVMREAVKAGLAGGQPGDILLFSPGFASFGLFKNEYERNDEFVKAVGNLQ